MKFNGSAKDLEAFLKKNRLMIDGDHISLANGSDDGSITVHCTNGSIVKWWGVSTKTVLVQGANIEYTKSIFGQNECNQALIEPPKERVQFIGALDRNAIALEFAKIAFTDVCAKLGNYSEAMVAKSAFSMADAFIKESNENGTHC